MEGIIKIFRRVMLAVIIIPFLSVFAMPNYSVRAAENEGIYIMLNNGNTLMLENGSLPTKEPGTNNAGGGKAWLDGGVVRLQDVNVKDIYMTEDAHIGFFSIVGNSTVSGNVVLADPNLAYTFTGSGNFEVGGMVSVASDLYLGSGVRSRFGSLRTNLLMFGGSDKAYIGGPSVIRNLSRNSSGNFDLEMKSETQVLDEVPYATDVYYMANYDSTEPIGELYGENLTPELISKDSKLLKYLKVSSIPFATNDASVKTTVRCSPTNLPDVSTLVTNGNGMPITASVYQNGAWRDYASLTSLPAGEYQMKVHQDGDAEKWVAGFDWLGTLTVNKNTWTLDQFKVNDAAVPRMEFTTPQSATINTTYKNLTTGEMTDNPTAPARYELYVDVPESSEYYKLDSTPTGYIFDNRAHLTGAEASLNIPTNLTYTGDALTPEVSFGKSSIIPEVGNSTFMYSKPTDTKFDARWWETNPIDAGTYDVGVISSGGTKYLPISEPYSLGTLVVNKAELHANNFKEIAETVPYDGESHPVNVEYFDTKNDGKINVSYKDSNGDTVKEPVDAGTYKVYVTTEEGNNYHALTTETLVGSIEITKKDNSAGYVQVKNNAKTYNGEVQHANVDIPSEYGEVQNVYYTKVGSTEPVSPTDAGEYDIYADILGSKNYKDAPKQLVGVMTIDRATPTKSDFKSDSTAVYTGKELNANVAFANKLLTDETAGKIIVNYDKSPVDVGKYKVSVTNVGGSNYHSATLDLGTFEITKAPVTKADLTGKANNATYDGKEHGASYDWKAGMVGTGALTLTYKGEGYNSTVAPVTAGTYEIYASAPAGANYQALESVKVADLKIIKANLTAKNFNDVSANYVYDFKSHPAKVAYLPGTEGTAPIVVTYKTAAGKTVSGAPTNAGTYDVYAQALKAGVNYNAMAKPVKVGTIKIAKADKPLPQIKVSDNKFTYDGKSHQAKVTMDKKYGDLSVTYKDEQGKTVAKPTNAGVYQIVVNTVSDNFEALKNVTVGELTINAATPKSSEFAFTKSGTYNGKSQSAKVAYAPGVTEEMAGKMTVHYVDAKGNKTNSITNAGSYKVYVSTTGGTNFKPVNNLLIGNMTIAKAPVASDEFSVKNVEVTFNGQSQSPTVTLPAKYGDITKIEYRDENGKIYDKVENPGKYDILVTTKGTANYAGADRLVVGTFTIDEQTPTPAPNDNGGNAGGTTPAASTVVPASGPAAYNATTTVPATTAGTTTSAVAPATQTPTTGTQTQATATPAADNATIRHGAITDPLHGPEEVSDPVSSVAQKDTPGLSNYTIAGIWMAVAVALAGALYIGMRWMQVGRKRHMMQK